MSVRARSGHLLHREATVHDTDMQLHGLGQTNGEPERKHAGEAAGDPTTAHGSNIR